MSALFAELFGTAILIVLGDGVVANVVLQRTKGNNSGWIVITTGWALAVTIAVYCVISISGAHLNPAVTIALAAFKGFEWRKVVPYALAQFLGAFVAALLVRWNYTEVLHAADPNLTIKTQGVFSTLPGNGTLPVGEWGAFRDQIIGTAILLFLVFAVTDARNNPPASWLAPFIIGLIVVAIGMAWGTNAGYAINPARDLGPRVASFLTGYGSAFHDQNGALFFWIPIVGPLVGGLLGAAAYKLLIARVLPDPDEDDEPPSFEPDDPSPLPDDEGSDEDDDEVPSDSFFDVDLPLEERLSVA